MIYYSFEEAMHCKDQMETLELLVDTKDRANNLSKNAFETFCCMIMEEYCRENSMDVVDFSQSIADNVRIMVKRKGSY